MKNKVILITGASSGIGKATAILAAQKGAKLVLAARQEQRLHELATELQNNYQSDVLVVRCDVADAKQLDYLVEQTMQQFQRIDILINCAGYGVFKSAVDFSYQETQAMYAVNTLGMIYLASLVARQMKQQQSGHIFFVCSIAGKLTTPSASVYSSTKAAMISYANALRMELKTDNILVTTVNPGPVKTAFFAHSTEMENYYQKVKQFAIDAEDVAEKMIQVAMSRSKKRELNLPMTMAVAAKFSQLFPKISDYFASNVFNFK